MIITHKEKLFPAPAGADDCAARVHAVVHLLRHRLAAPRRPASPRGLCPGTPHPATVRTSTRMSHSLHSFDSKVLCGAALLPIMLLCSLQDNVHGLRPWCATQLVHVSALQCSTWTTRVMSCCRSSQLHMLYAMSEWRGGAIGAARTIFAKGAALGESDAGAHLPLLEAWLQMEQHQGDESAAQRVQYLIECSNERTAAKKGDVSLARVDRDVRAAVQQQHGAEAADEALPAAELEQGAPVATTAAQTTSDARAATEAVAAPVSAETYSAIAPAPAAATSDVDLSAANSAEAAESALDEQLAAADRDMAVESSLDARAADAATSDAQAAGVGTVARTDRPLHEIESSSGDEREAVGMSATVPAQQARSLRTTPDRSALDDQIAAARAGASSDSSKAGSADALQATGDALAAAAPVASGAAPADAAPRQLDAVDSDGDAEALSDAMFDDDTAGRGAAVAKWLTLDEPAELDYSIAELAAQRAAGDLAETSEALQQPDGAEGAETATAGAADNTAGRAAGMSAAASAATASAQRADEAVAADAAVSGKAGVDADAAELAWGQAPHKAESKPQVDSWALDAAELPASAQAPTTANGTAQPLSQAVAPLAGDSAQPQGNVSGASRAPVEVQSQLPQADTWALDAAGLSASAGAAEVGHSAAQPGPHAVAADGDSAQHQENVSGTSQAAHRAEPKLPQRDSWALDAGELPVGTVAPAAASGAAQPEPQGVARGHHRQSHHAGPQAVAGDGVHAEHDENVSGASEHQYVCDEDDLWAGSGANDKPEQHSPPTAGIFEASSTDPVLDSAAGEDEALAVQVAAPAAATAGTVPAPVTTQLRLDLARQVLDDSVGVMQLLQQFASAYASLGGQTGAQQLRQDLARQLLDDGTDVMQLLGQFAFMHASLGGQATPQQSSPVDTASQESAAQPVPIPKAAQRRVPAENASEQSAAQQAPAQTPTAQAPQQSHPADAPDQQGAVQRAASHAPAAPGPQRRAVADASSRQSAGQHATAEAPIAQSQAAQQRHRAAAASPQGPGQQAPARAPPAQASQRRARRTGRAHNSSLRSESTEPPTPAAAPAAAATSSPAHSSRAKRQAADNVVTPAPQVAPQTPEASALEAVTPTEAGTQVQPQVPARAVSDVRNVTGNSLSTGVPAVEPAHVAPPAAPAAQAKQDSASVNGNGAARQPRTKQQKQQGQHRRRSAQLTELFDASASSENSASDDREQAPAAALSDDTGEAANGHIEKETAGVR